MNDQTEEPRATREEIWQARFERPLLLAAALVIPVIVLQEASVPSPWPQIAQFFNWAIWLAFLAEVVVMLSVVENRRAWANRHLVDVMVVVLTPPFIPAQLAGLRVLRLLRLLRLGPLIKRAFTPQGMRYAGLMAILTVLAGGVAFHTFEPNASFSTGVWWSIETIVTGNISAVQSRTDASHATGLVLVLVGTALIAYLTGALAERFIRGDFASAQEVEETELDNQDLILEELRKLGSRLEALEARRGTTES